MPFELGARDLEALIDDLPIVAGRAEPDDEAAWALLATLVRYASPDSRVGVADLWSGDLVPDSPRDWKRATRALFKHHWASEVECRLHLEQRLRFIRERGEQACERYDAMMAHRLLNATTSAIDRPRTAAWTEFTRSWDALRRLQGRDLGESA